MHTSYTPSSQAIAVPAEVVADFFIVEAQVAGLGPFQFLVDTGSSVSLVSPSLARQLGDAGNTPGASFAIRTSSPRTATLPAIALPRLEVGAAAFRSVPAAVFDFGDLSQQLGTRIDGQPTPEWPLERYQTRLRSSEAVTVAFVSTAGRESDPCLPLVEFVR